MAITYPLSIPTEIGVEQIELRAVHSVGLSESPFTFRQQVVRHQGERWEASIRIPPVKANLAEPWITFLLKLRGQYGTFLLGDPSRPAPLGSASTTPGFPLVRGGNQTGDELFIDGGPSLATGYLIAGDYIQLGSGATATLHKVLNDVDLTSSGEAIIDIWPRIIIAPEDNATVTVTGATGRFRLRDNITSWTINNISSFGLEFEAVGVVP